VSKPGPIQVKKAKCLMMNCKNANFSTFISHVGHWPRVHSFGGAEMALTMPLYDLKMPVRRSFEARFFGRGRLQPLDFGREQRDALGQIPRPTTATRS